MDVIDLVEEYKKIGKHQAIIWLQENFNLGTVTQPKQEEKKPDRRSREMRDFVKLFKVFRSRFKASEKAKGHLEGRSIDCVALEIGYNVNAMLSA
jgi:hypothetical protein